MLGTRNSNSASSTWQTYVLVACVAAATLGLELVQTRILSFLYQNNIVYLTVTIVLLGFGISGVFVSLFASRAQNPQRAIALLTAAFLFSSFACLALVSRIPEYFPNANVLYKLLGSYIILVIPFLCSGAVLGWIFMLQAKNINRLYFVDLVLSSGAVLAFVLLLQPLGAEWFIWLCSTTILVGLLTYSYQILPVRWLGCITIGFAAAMFLFTAHHLLGKYPEKYKTLGYFLRNSHALIEETKWNPLTRIDIFTTPNSLFFAKTLSQDGDAPTYLLGPNIVDSKIQELKEIPNFIPTPTCLMYFLKENPENTLVIGVGGGEDIMNAKIMGAHYVTGVEINPVTVSLMKGRYRDYVQWPNWQGVTLVNAEGRNYVHSKPGSFDTIIMRGVDTFSALSSGAYVLSENYLYTVEAMHDYLNALKPDGIMTIARLLFLKPRESLRLTSIYLQAAKEMQIPYPEKSIMVVAEKGPDPKLYWGITLLKKGIFTEAEVNKILALLADKPYLSMIYIPKVFPAEVQANLEKTAAAKVPQLQLASAMFNQLITSSEDERANFIRDYEFRIDSVVDDRPFFFENYKEKGWFELESLSNVAAPRKPTVLYALLAACSLICLSCIFVPLWIFQKRGLNTPGALPLLWFFGALGFGFMTFEIGSMQVVNVYIGYPAYSLPLVLGGLLFATGLGSMFSNYFTKLPGLQIITIATITVAISMITWLGFVHFIEPLTMQLPLIARAAIILLTLFPMGILLGFPFPTAVRETEKYYPGFIAWAWGINGITSVLATVTTIIIAMKIGFTMVIFMAATTYVLGAVAYWKYATAIQKNAVLAENLSTVVQID
ncbi:MAG: hypothetical protein V4501_01685 [Pseudomonadota bacterium]